MPVTIKKIEIINFRSIQKIIIDCTRLQLLVGYNDAGKSNILRALNLFFNAQTNPDEHFNFKTDYNIYADRITTTRKKAKEIKISLTLEIPESYKKTNGDYIEWSKSWRLHESSEEIYGFKNVEGPRGGVKINKIEIPARSNLKALLANIKFLYVPAIKDKDYISKLRSEIYQVVNEAFNDNFSKSSQDFEESIAENLQELTNDISHSLGFKSTLSLPKDLSHLFERLDFLNENAISLNERGDGVKARHIPLILKFIAEKRKGLQAQGIPPYTYIWGYEEPENNLEITNAIKLAEQLKNMIQDPVSQIFLTTHSPAFYNLAKQYPESINCYYIDKDSHDITVCEQDLSVLDNKMGLMELLTPHIEAMRSELEKIQEVWELGRDKPVIYVEGPSDQIVLKKALEFHTPGITSQLDIITIDFGGGTNYVSDMLTAYYHMHKHHKERYNAVGLVDPDCDGRKCKKKIGDLLDASRVKNGHAVKCILMKLSRDVRDAQRDGFNIPGVLEDNYPISIWNAEHQRGKLIKRDTEGLFNSRVQDELINSSKTLDDLLENKAYALKVKYKINPLRKVNLANKVNQLSINTIEQDLEFLFPCINEILSFLKISTPSQEKN